jgi:hypothetical protein
LSWSIMICSRTADPAQSASIASSMTWSRPNKDHNADAGWHWNRRCRISSGAWEQIGHYLLVPTYLLARIDFRGISPWRERHAKILILLGILSCHNSFQTGLWMDVPRIAILPDRGAKECFHSRWYADRTENWPFRLWFHAIKPSNPWMFKGIWSILLTSIE